jgi:hypothetical protein
VLQQNINTSFIITLVVFPAISVLLIPRGQPVEEALRKVNFRLLLSVPTIFYNHKKDYIVFFHIIHTIQSASEVVAVSVETSVPLVFNGS